jgi:hypothetical protein
MALAAFRLIDDDGEHLRFQADVGTNAWFRWALGDGEQVRTTNGVRVLEAPVHASPLLGPVPRPARGRTTFEVPRRLIGRAHRHIQLMTFRTEDGAGPAISDVVPLPPAGAPPSDALPDISLPPRPFAFAAGKSIPRIPMQTHVEPFSFVERPVMSQAMFFGAITGLLSSLLPKVAPIVGQVGPLLGKLLGGAGGAGRDKKLTDAELGQAINELLEVIGSAMKDPAKAMAIGQALSSSHRELTREAAGVANGHSQAMFWQMLLNPETLKAAGEVAKGLLEAADKSDQAFKQHLRDLIKGVDDPGLDRLLESMSLRTAAFGGDVKFKLDERTRLAWTPPMALVGGRQRPVYRHGSDLALGLTLETPRTLARATLLVAIKDLDTLEPLARRAIKLSSLSSGPIAGQVVLPRTTLGKLVPGKEALLCATLVWNENGKRRGTGVEERFLVAGELVFERFEGSGEPIALSDPDRYRAFWHKVWQETFSKDTRRYELDTKYYVRLEPHRAENGRIETLTKTEKGALWKEAGRMKSGLLLSLSSLDAAAQMLGARALTPAELEALRGAELEMQLSLAARHKVELAGRAGDSVALWVYPSMKMQTGRFQRAGDVEGGWIKSFSEHTATVPVPVLLHFIGVTSAHDSAPSAAPILNGMKVVFDHEVALYPVNLRSKKREIRDERRASYAN